MLLNEEFIRLYEELALLNEETQYKNSHLELAKPIKLTDCRMIKSDVVDIRGELEQSACLDYNGVLTRVGAQALIFRDGQDGKEVLMRLWRSAVYLPGGGIDLAKDGANAVNTVQREISEEVNLKVKNIRPTSFSYWEYNEKSWVEKHVENPKDRWNGYYTYIFTADYAGDDNNELPEESGRYRWYKVQDILNRQDTRKLKYLKEAIIENGYDVSLPNNELEEEATLNEGKQLGLVSYAIRPSKSAKEPLRALESILYSGVIKASEEEDGTMYVSTSRNLMSHLKTGSDWKYGIVLDGDKLANKYKFTPVNYNSIVYYGSGKSKKQLELNHIAKYQAKDKSGNFIDKFFYLVNMQGNSFLTNITEATYEILKTIMQAYNAQLAVKSDGVAQDKYKGKTNKEVKKFYDLRGNEKVTTSDKWLKYLADNTPEGEEPPEWMKDTATKLDQNKNQPWMLIGTTMQKSRVPQRLAEYTWICVEAVGYNVQNSGLFLKVTELEQYKELVLSKHGVDVTASDFFSRISGNYADESEERATAQLVDMVDVYGEWSKEQKNFGMDISGCIKAILIDEKHTMAFTLSENELAKRKTLYLYDNGQMTTKVDNTPYLKYGAVSVRNFAERNNIPIILFNQNMTNKEIIDQIN